MAHDPVTRSDAIAPTVASSSLAIECSLAKHQKAHRSERYIVHAAGASSRILPHSLRPHVGLISDRGPELRPDSARCCLPHSVVPTPGTPRTQAAAAIGPVPHAHGASAGCARGRSCAIVLAAPVANPVVVVRPPRHCLRGARGVSPYDPPPQNAPKWPTTGMHARAGQHQHQQHASIHQRGLRAQGPRAPSGGDGARLRRISVTFCGYASKSHGVPSIYTRSPRPYVRLHLPRKWQMKQRVQPHGERACVRGHAIRLLTVPR